ncbi:MAG: OadG family protein [Clostridia bacterium]|nr:OadG family protein [Clostridia bacterium]
MLNTLLTSAIPFEAKLTEGLLTFCIGMVVIFFGIALIVICVKLAGYLFSTNKEQPKKEQPKKVEEKPIEQPVVVSNDIPNHVKLAIIGAITAYYYENQKSNCEFVVKKIKRY